MIRARLKLTALLFTMIASTLVQGQTIVVTDVDDLVYGDPSAAYIQAVATVTNSGSTDLDVLVKFEELSAGPVGSGHYFCWAVCYNEGGVLDGFETPANHSLTIAAGASTNNFYSDYVPHGTIGIASYRYTFFERNNPSNSASIDITFDTQNVSVDEITSGTNGVSESYPNPATDFAKINYGLKPGWNDAELVVYSMLGSQVRSIKLNEEQGTVKLNVNDLPSGMYFYTLMVDDKSIATKKMLVTK